jgi:hypothetical protein
VMRRDSSRASAFAFDPDWDDGRAVGGLEQRHDG